MSNSDCFISKQATNECWLSVVHWQARNMNYNRFVTGYCLGSSQKKAFRHWNFQIDFFCRSKRRHEFYLRIFSSPLGPYKSIIGMMMKPTVSLKDVQDVLSKSQSLTFERRLLNKVLFNFFHDFARNSFFLGLTSPPCGILPPWPPAANVALPS